jgi:hypothetical protein
MTRRVCAFGMILLTVVSSCGVLLACGDKFLVANRGTRFQRAAAPREPAAILIYTSPAAELMAGAAVDTTLQKVGYRPTTVGTTTDFEKALERGGWDIVLVSVLNAPAVSKRLPNNVVVVPVVFNATSTELKEAKTQYKVVVKAPVKSQSLLEAIDEALALRPKPQRKAI